MRQVCFGKQVTSLSGSLIFFLKKKFQPFHPQRVFFPLQCLLTHEELAHIKTRRAAAALVEDEPSGSAKEATAAFSMDRGPLDTLVLIVHAGKTDAVLLEQPLSERTHHVTS